jgi:hypothetical protein
MKTDSDVVLYFGKFQGKTLGEAPTWYLGWLFASFSHGERLVEPELRRRGATDADLNGFRRRHPRLGKKPKSLRERGDGK